MPWMEALKRNITTGTQLQSYLSLPEEEVKKIDAIVADYPMSIPEYYLSLIDPADPADPVRKMCIPSVIEQMPGGAEDTSGEGSNTVITGLQHKYSQTALILSTSRCAMYCRHCFRKRMVGATDKEVLTHFQEMVDYVTEHTEISNILVSGGDSFLNSNYVIAKYLDAFTQIDHLDFIRFGTRVPVVLPQRITEDPELLDLLERYNHKKTIYVITQFNHPNEITPQATKAVEALEKVGITVKNQAVLLKGVNDNPDTMATLMRRLTSIGVDPYYVFQCRPVTGVKNQFQVPILTGYRVMEEAKSKLNGLAKSFNYVMSHETGKMEFLGIMEGNQMLFRYQEAKYPQNYGKTFVLPLKEDQCWLDELPKDAASQYGI